MLVPLARIFGFRCTVGLRSATASPAEVLFVVMKHTVNFLTMADPCCCRLAELPDAVGALTQLQSLSTASCGLRQLPDAVGRLQRLSALDVRNNSLRQLPASLGKFSPSDLFVQDLTARVFPLRTGAFRASFVFMARFSGI